MSKKPNTRNLKVISITLDVRSIEIARELCVDTGLSLSALVRSMLRDELTRRKRKAIA